MSDSRAIISLGGPSNLRDVEALSGSKALPVSSSSQKIADLGQRLKKLRLQTAKGTRVIPTGLARWRCKKAQKRKVTCKGNLNFEGNSTVIWRKSESTDAEK